VIAGTMSRRDTSASILSAGQANKAAAWLAAAGYGLLDAVDVIGARAGSLILIDPR